VRVDEAHPPTGSVRTRALRLLPIMLTTLVLHMQPSLAAGPMPIDDFTRDDGLSLLGTPWRLVTDRVMGGVSDARLSVGERDGRRALCLTGDVSLANNGGFVQTNLDLSGKGTLDASHLTGVRLVVSGNGEGYKVHIKTPDTVLPWQSYRADFRAGEDWREVRLPFVEFEPHRVDPPLDTRRLSRLGIVAIGRAMTAEVCLAEIGLY
jgi:hypothetical protein